MSVDSVRELGTVWLGSEGLTLADMDIDMVDT